MGHAIMDPGISSQGMSSKTLMFLKYFQFGNIEMKITRQPTNHRAQYIGEGSRGPMRSQKGYPAVKISNYKGSGLLRLYLATEDDPIRYHPFYQVCKVMTKNMDS